MQTDPYSDPAGTAPGEGGGAPSPDQKVIDENAKLRAEVREVQAKMLGKDHGLTPTEIALLANVNRDKQEEMAQKIAEERATAAAAQPAPATDPAPAPTPPPDPAPTPDPAPPANPGVGAAEGGTPVGGTSASWQEAMDKEVANAKGVDDIDRIQQKYAKIATGETAWTPEG